MKIKQKVLKELRTYVNGLTGYDKREDELVSETIDLTLAEVSKCKICGKKSDFDLLSVECPDCYLKGCKKELEKQKTEVGKVIDKRKCCFKDIKDYRELKKEIGI